MKTYLKIFFLFFFVSASAHAAVTSFYMLAQIWRKVAVTISHELIMPEILTDRDPATNPIYSNEPTGADGQITITGPANALATMQLPASITIRSDANMFSFTQVQLETVSGLNTCTLDAYGHCTFDIRGTIIAAPTGGFIEGNYSGPSGNIVAVTFL